MACPSVTTGGQVLAETLSHLDCQAQTLGSFGFQSLAAPGSPASLALTGLLTLFIAMFAIRMLLADGVGGRDAVNGIIKVGIVLTLAVSWPAFRILAYDTVLLAPAEVASSITPSTLPDTGAGFTQRLQNIDTGIATLTLQGGGWQTGSMALEQLGDDTIRTIAIADSTALGWARAIYLSAVIGALAILRDCCCSISHAACSRAGCGAWSSLRSARSGLRCCWPSRWRWSNPGWPTCCSDAPSVMRPHRRRPSCWRSCSPSPRRVSACSFCLVRWPSTMRGPSRSSVG